MAEPAKQDSVTELLTADWQDVRVEELDDDLLDRLKSGEPDDQVRVYENSLDAGETLPTHAHGDPQAIVVTSGELTIVVDGDVYEVQEGDALVLPSLTPNRMEAGEEDTVYLVVSRN